MNITTIKALQPFSHGAYTLARGELREMPTPIANDLAAAGLVETIVEKLPEDDERAAALAREAKAHDAKVAKDAAAAPAADEPEEKAAQAHANKAAKPLANKAK